MPALNFKDKLLEGTEDVLSQVKDDQHKKVLVKLTDKITENISSVIDDAVSSRVQDEMSRRGLSAKPIRQSDKAFQMMLSAFRNNGLVDSQPGLKLTVQDMLDADSERLSKQKSGDLKPEDYVAKDGAFLWDNPLLMPRVISTLVREPAEPIQVLAPLFDRVNLPDPLTQMRFPAVSAFQAGDLDMDESGRYPEGMMNFAATIVATVGRSGIKVRFNADTLKYSLYDVMGMHLRGAGRALAMWKEQKCADAISAAGVTVLDNLGGDPDAYTTGRNINGLYNGTLSMQDLHTVMASTINDGFMPDTIGINPMGWTIFAQDPLMRSWAYAQGGVNRIWQRVRGEVAQIRQWMQGMNGTTTPDDPQQIQSTYTEIPDLFPYPLRLLISPQFPYDPVANTVDLVMMDTRELGILSVGQDIRTSKWVEPEREITNVALDESYAVNILNEGRGIRRVKNVFLKRSYDLDDKITLALTGPVPTGTDGFDL